MKLLLISRRNKFRILFYGGLIFTAVYGFIIEPQWILVKQVVLSQNPKCRLVHVSDIHYTGDESYLIDIVNRINRISPDFVCFTGDLVEEKHDLQQALDILGRIRCPVFGVPGNHDYWSGVSFDAIGTAFKNTGGAWLTNQRIYFRDIEITGMADEAYKPPPPVSGSRRPEKKVLLTHYPALVNQLFHDKFDLILAGHSHGGQIRLPFFGAIKAPYGVGKYEKGLFDTEAGILYVNQGLGTYGIHMRLCCRPEITIIEL